MKKLFILLTFALVGQLASAQWMLGGSFQLWGGANNLSFSLAPEVAYEVSERWEVGLGLGVDLDYTYASKATTCNGMVMPFASYKIWGNELLEFRAKALGSVEFARELEIAELGVEPELVITPCEHFELGFSLGFLGARYTNFSGWSGGLLFDSSANRVSFTYIFD